VSVTAVFAALAPVHSLAAEAAPDGAVGEIVVTGTRLSSQNFQQPTPVQAVTADALQNTAPTTLAEGLRKIPALAQTSDGAAQGQSGNGTGAIAAINLRGLGSSRSLVLIDGQRVTPTTNAGIVDLQLFPQNLIKRVDVVTGGASATYGSDAVAGVVNFIIDRAFTGFKADVGGGITEQGDGSQKKIMAALGHSFFNDRVHVVFSGEHYETGKVYSDDRRDWTQRGIAIIPNPAVTKTNPASASNPNFITRPNTRYSNVSIGGFVPSGPLAGLQFINGQPASFMYGSDVSASAMSGGNDTSIPRPTDLGYPINRTNLYMGVTVDVTPTTTAYFSASWARQGAYDHNANFTVNATAYSGNPYLPAAVQAQMNAANVTSFPLNKGFFDLDNIIWDDTSGLELTAELAGKVNLGSNPFNWKLHYEHGRGTYYRSSYVAPNVFAFFNAADAVTVTTANQGTSGLPVGSIVCRTSLANPRNGCVPINLFIPLTANAKTAYDYVAGDEKSDPPYFHQYSHQDAAEFSASGQPFSLWAGPVDLALGVDYRNLDVTLTGDYVSSIYPAAFLAENPGIRGVPASFATSLNPGLFVAGNYQPSHGSYHVEEGFAETNVPLVRDFTLVKKLDLNAAYRYANYSNAGGISAWKIGGVWDVVDGIRLRGVRSRDIRAGNALELYSAIRAGNITVTDRTTGQTSQTYQYAQGNRSVSPEKADTWTGGVVFTRGRLNASVDYYNITVNDAIAAPAAQFVVDQCFYGNQDYCGRITRTNGAITALDLRTTNFAQVKTQGVDFDLSYSIDSEKIISGLPGLLAARLSATHVNNITTYIARSAPTEAVGVGSNPRSWMAALALDYTGDHFSFSINERFIGPGVINRAYNTDKYNLPGVAITYIDNNHVDHQFLTDISMRYALANHRVEIYGVIQNLWNTDPPVQPILFSGQPIQSSTPYDIQGRRFAGGVRLRF
jgi:outer membrane receptor protein involved in Fe transport